MDYDLDTLHGMANSVSWLNGLLSTLNDGGTWAIPRSGTIYRIHHSKKEAVKIAAMLPDPSLDRVFKAAGWTVIDEAN